MDDYTKILETWKRQLERQETSKEGVPHETRMLRKEESQLKA